jgi:hypothetical protein
MEMKKMGVNAREVVREGNRLGYKFARGNYDTCAIGFLSQTTHLNDYERERMAVALGLTKTVEPLGEKIIWAIERGFEDDSVDGQKISYYDDEEPKTRNLLRRYFNVGRNIARNAKLRFYDYDRRE